MDPRGSFAFDLLDTKSNEAISSYEHSLYKAFSSRDFLDPVRIVDHKLHRTQTKIPYQAQDVFIVRLKDKIVAAMAINYDMNNTLQLELRGFSINKDQPHICEVLHLFSNIDLMNGKPVIETLGDFALNKIALRNVNTIFITCTERRLNSYQKFGFSLVAQNDLPFNGSKRFLLVTNLTKG